SAQTERAAKIIDHMRMFGRRATEAAQPICVLAAVNGALDLMGEQLRLEEVEIDVRSEENLSNVTGHQVQLEQVFLNLLGNARDAMEGAEGKKQIHIALKSAKDGANEITTRDTGGGIPKDNIDRIFEPFFTTKEMGKGTGLGLSVSYGIIRDMDGMIEAANIDEGAEFKITLPMASAAEYVEGAA
ncbi:MAG: ATP-binding protein, partial [Alphaproteobacteria bacterium]